MFESPKCNALIIRVLILASFSQLAAVLRSEEHTSELQSLLHLVCRLLLEKNKEDINTVGDAKALFTIDDAADSYTALFDWIEKHRSDVTPDDFFVAGARTDVGDCCCWSNL